MALRILCVVLALSTLIATGCRRTANYRPACAPAPAVVAVTPVAPAPCPNGQVPAPPAIVPGPPALPPR